MPRSPTAISGGIPNLLDELGALDLTGCEGNPPDAVDNPDDVKEYSLKIRWRSGQVDLMDGSYDKLSLPEDFPELVERVDWNDPIILYDEDGMVIYDPSDPKFMERQKEKKLEEISDEGVEEDDIGTE